MDAMQDTLDQILQALRRPGIRTTTFPSLPLSAMTDPYAAQSGQQPNGTSAAALSQTAISSSSGPATGATPQSPFVPPAGQQLPWYPKDPLKPPPTFSGDKKDEALDTWLRMVPVWVRAKRTFVEEEVIIAASYSEGSTARWLNGLVASKGFGRNMSDWAQTHTLESFMELVEARWHNPQQSQIATDGLLKLDSRNPNELSLRLGVLPSLLIDLKLFLSLAHDLLEDDEETFAEDPSLDDDQEQGCEASCSSSAHESEYVYDKESMNAFKKTAFKNLKLTFVVTTDASLYGIGAVLQQDDGDGLRPLEYYSKRMLSHKVAASTYMRELYALREALDHWKHYLLGRHFKVFSDHETLKWIQTQINPSTTLTRWLHQIDVYDFQLKHKKGCYNRVADALSRHPEYMTCLVGSCDLRKNLKEELVQHTAKDPELSPVLEQIRADPSSRPDFHEYWKDFTSQIFDIKLKMTYDRHHEANGLAEEINQTVIQLLRALIVPDQNSWDEELPTVQGLYNNSIHSSTGMTPNWLHLEWKIRNPLSYPFPEQPPGLTPGQPGYRAKFDRLLKVAIAAMERRPSAMIKHANKKRQPDPFTVGSYVWVKMSEFSKEGGVSRKLLPQYYSPWKVLNRVGDDSFGPSYTIDRPFVVITDASQYGIGPVLDQQEGKKLRPVEYMSKKMSSKKLAKSTYERELYALYKALVHWRHYLLGRFPYLRTDHRTLKWIKTQPVLSDALKCWIEVIDQYDFKPNYVKGEYNEVADALSRRADYLGALISEFGLSEDVTRSLGEAYKEDPITMDIINKLQAKDKATCDEFVMVDGLLFLEKAGFKRLVVPSREILRSLFLGECHDATGHFSDKKASANLVERFWWTNMLDDAKKYLQSCQVCQRDKPRTQAPLGLLKPLPIPAGLGQSISMDFMDTLVTSKNGKRHIFIIVDRHTKFARLVAMLETTRTKHVIKLFMDNWVRDFGLPKTIVSDRDVRFTSEMWKKAAEQMGSQLQMTSGNHQANGQAEQMNRVVQHLLRHYIKPSQDDWDEKLPLIASLYNNVVQSTTGVTPNQLHLGWKPRSALDFLLPENRTAATPGTIEFGVQYEKLLQQTVEHIKKSQEAMIASENKKRRQSTFQTLVSRLGEEEDRGCETGEGFEDLPGDVVCDLLFVSMKCSALLDLEPGNTAIEGMEKKIISSHNPGLNMKGKKAKKKPRRCRGGKKKGVDRSPPVIIVDEPLFFDCPGIDVRQEPDLLRILKMLAKQRGKGEVLISNNCGCRWLKAWRPGVRNAVGCIKSEYVNGVAQAFEGLVMSPLDRNTSETWLECPKLYEAGLRMMFLDNENYERVAKPKSVVLRDMKEKFDESRLGDMARWDREGELQHAYILAKEKDKRKRRPIVPSFASPFRSASGLLSTVLNTLIRNVSVPHFNLHAMCDLKDEISKINQYGRTTGTADLSFVARTYDIKEMFTQLPHCEIIKAVQWVVEVFHQKGIRRIRVNMRKKVACFGEAHGEAGWKTVRLSKLGLLTDFQLENTYFLVSNTVLRQKKGIPMGGRASPSLACIMCMMAEHQFLWSLGTDSKFITGKRYIDDLLVVSFFRLTDQTGRSNAEKRLDLVTNCYPDGLVLERTDPGNGILDFLETRLVVSGDTTAILMSHKFKNVDTIWEEGPLRFQTFKNFSSFGPRMAKFATVANTIQRIANNSNDSGLTCLNVLSLVEELWKLDYPGKVVTTGLRWMEKRDEPLFWGKMTEVVEQWLFEE
ncbi:hypothetical protein CBR_g40232 [Chara braunii]|uniref:Integrase catalytic domain-containing protein n=1 Tax=Chara braunii TaxID=69332 RepID=A0A388K1R6_CHABU|nr:hypothetical protein CBR_g40232 [Chara braunii]|eukprot:GBG63988.1 hypothetical protein CBR_g40232 [Chara braunii]